MIAIILTPDRDFGLDRDVGRTDPELGEMREGPLGLGLTEPGSLGAAFGNPTP